MSLLPEVAGSLQPADRCPYRGPFTRDFQECPTFRPAAFTVADSTEKLLGTGITCGHLRSGEQSRHHFYPRCSIGSQVERLEWLGVVSPARLAIVRTVSDEFETLNAGYRERLMEAKMAVLTNPGDLTARSRLEALLRQFLERVDEFLAARSERLEDIGLPADRLSDLISEWSLAWMRSKELEAPASDGGAIAGLNPEAAALVGQALGRDGDAESALETRFADATLRVLRDPSSGVLSFLGEIDASNVADVEQVLAGAEADGGAGLQIDLSALSFCDLGGLRAIVRASAERRIVITGMTPQIERALRIAGWAELPNLVVDGLAEERDAMVEA